MTAVIAELTEPWLLIHVS